MIRHLELIDGSPRASRAFARLAILLGALAFVPLTLAGCGSESDSSPDEQSCTDGRDDDLDGLFDCSDPDCANRPACVREHCYNLVDDDGDGDIDCADSQCSGRSVCTEESEDCVNGRDDDSNGLADCDDEKCSATAACSPDGENCTNGADDDGDSEVDCDDSDCAKTAVCGTVFERCEDGTDNDEDGAVDCEDDDCTRTATCLDSGEVCDDGTDNDGDGAIDCVDVDCAYTSSCGGATEACDNDIDDDGDGAVDCADDDCDGASACARVCSTDTDGDGTPDCSDSDIDGDDVDNARDNCPIVENGDQADRDGDDVGDACDDGDRDGHVDATDNCPDTRNLDQRDRDGDGTGNACDPSADIADADFSIAKHPGYAGPPTFVAAGDATGDGAPDVLFNHAFDPLIWIVPDVLSRPGQTVGLDDAVVLEHEASGEVLDVAAGDIDGSGDLDIVYAFERAGSEVEIAVHVDEVTSGADLAADTAVRSVVLPDPSTVVIMELHLVVDDVDADGRDDLLVGVPNALGESGGVYAFSGARLVSGDGSDLAPGDADWSVKGDVAGRDFGSSIQVTDDFDGDGAPEIIISDDVSSGLDHVFVLQSNAFLNNLSLDQSAWMTFALDAGSFLLEFISDIDGNGLADVHYRGGECVEGGGTIGHAVFPMTTPPPTRVWGDSLNFFVCNDTAPQQFDQSAHFVELTGDASPEFVAPVQTAQGPALYIWDNWEAARDAPGTPDWRIDALNSPGNLEARSIGDLDGDGTDDLIITDGFGSSNTEDQRIWLWP